MVSRWLWFSFMVSMGLLILAGAPAGDGGRPVVLAGGFFLLAPFVYFHDPLRLDGRPMADWSTAQWWAAVAGLGGVLAVLVAALGTL